MEPVAVWTRKGGEWGDNSSMSALWSSQLQSNSCRRQSDEVDVYRNETVGVTAFPLERIEEMTQLMGGDGSIARG